MPTDGEAVNEPARERLPEARPAAFVLRRITGPVLAAVVPGQPPAIVHRAAELAYTLNVKLICVYVDITSYLADEQDNGPVDDAEATSAGIQEHLENTLDGTGIRWSFRTLSGEPARALGQFAESTDASVIVVGTRELGLGIRLEQLLVGSVAVDLTHLQHRPVLVVPLPRQAIPGGLTD
ncbi:universal stress protein [[Micrococcus luteus] ATCC 49442]|uniref:universal stress protein n=1 Tax=[Micrococcus luteus] ATCC 49442 TaxID=2698727 RepID=UPI001FCB2704|nr:universal stress protein [[Micrococcus luteus] ATCC 49442]